MGNKKQRQFKNFYESFILFNQIYYSHSINIAHSNDPFVETQLFRDKNKELLEEFDSLLYVLKADHANLK